MLRVLRGVRDITCSAQGHHGNSRVSLVVKRRGCPAQHAGAGGRPSVPGSGSRGLPKALAASRGRSAGAEVSLPATVFLQDQDGGREAAR